MELFILTRKAMNRVGDQVVFAGRNNRERSKAGGQVTLRREGKRRKQHKPKGFDGPVF
jgi:hypothetical protein